MTFARFMELALYDPDGGYYRGAEPRPGRSGDFLTAPEAHPIFGQALANQLIEVWERLDRPTPFVVREHGAGIGTLAEAILRRLERARPELLAVLRYEPVEIDARRLEAFGERLTAAGFADRITPADEDHSFTGVVLANEVLDALPVHRVGVRDGSLAERFVALGADGRLVDAWGPPSTPALGERLRAKGVQLADGQSAEVCLGLDAGSRMPCDRWIAVSCCSSTTAPRRRAVRPGPSATGHGPRIRQAPGQRRPVRPYRPPGPDRACRSDGARAGAARRSGWRRSGRPRRRSS